MIFPSTSSRRLTDVDMLMCICSACSWRIKGFARFFHMPQICESAHAGELQCHRLNFSWSLLQTLPPPTPPKRSDICWRRGKRLTAAHWP